MNNQEPTFPASQIPEGHEVIYRGLGWKSGKADFFFIKKKKSLEYINNHNHKLYRGCNAPGFQFLHYWEVVPKKEAMTPAITAAYKAGSYNAYWVAYYNQFRKPPTVTFKEFSAYVSKEHKISEEYCEESRCFPIRTFEEFKENEAKQFPSNPEEDQTPETKTKTNTMSQNYSNQTVATPTLILGKDVKDFTETEALNQIEIFEKKINRLKEIPGAADALAGKIQSFRRAQALLVAGLVDDAAEEAPVRPLSNGAPDEA